MTELTPTDSAQEMIPAWVDGTLRPVEKLAVHRHGLRHKAISVFLLRGNEVLIQRRALGKYHTPGLWANTCCTHPYWGEDARTCAERRLRQELGIAGIPLHHADQIEYRAEVGQGLIEHEVVDLFLGHVTGPLEITPNPDEVDRVDWIDLDRLCQCIVAEPGNFTPWLRIYLQEHRDRLFPAKG